MRTEIKNLKDNGEIGIKNSHEMDRVYSDGMRKEKSREQDQSCLESI